MTSMMSCFMQSEQQAKKELEQKKKVVPHLWNLNEDPSLSSMIIHFVQEGEPNLPVAPAVCTSGRQHLVCFLAN